MPSALLAKLSEFRRNPSAAAAVEMAFIAPVMIILGLLGVDTANYVIATEQVEQVANTIAQMITTTSPSSNGSTTGNVTGNDLQFYRDSSVVVYPGIFTDAARAGQLWFFDMQISETSIKFNPVSTTCTSGCAYTAMAIWAAGDVERQCRTPFTSVDDSSIPSLSTLPKHVFPTGPAPPAQTPYTIIAVDVVFTYHPLFASYFGAALPIARSVFIAPRYVNTITFQSSAFTGVPGYNCLGGGS